MPLKGTFGLSTVEDLELAIETCKDLISHAAEKSDKQKALVKKLIELRIKLHEIKVKRLEKRWSMTAFIMTACLRKGVQK